MVTFFFVAVTCVSISCIPLFRTCEGESISGNDVAVTKFDKLVDLIAPSMIGKGPGYEGKSFLQANLKMLL